MSYCKVQSEERLEYEQLFNEFITGCKTEQKLGMEYERIPVSKYTKEVVPYDGEFGICELLRQFAKVDNWDYILDGDEIIGLKKLHDTITLEPGCQLELSIEPQDSVESIKKKISEIDNNLKPLLEEFEIELLNFGVSPKTTYKNIKLIPKKRYHLMANYLWGILSDVMMRETAGIQVGIDYKSEEDAMRKFKLANKLSPFMTAMFANSPIRGGVDTGYKSFRALSWLNTDNDRCGFAGKISEEFSFDEYIDCVMKTPMLFIQRNNMLFEINGDITFEEFMHNGWKGEDSSIEDYELQANLYFPEVRMRNFIELRNTDCVGGNLKYAIPAIYKGIMYSKDAMSECEELFKHLQYKDFSELRYNVPKHALDTKIKNATVLDYSKEIIKIAEKHLSEMNTGEEILLEAIKEYTFNNICPADLILKNWYGDWNKDVSKLVNYLNSLEN